MHFWSQLVAILSLASVAAVSAAPHPTHNDTTNLFERRQMGSFGVDDHEDIERGTSGGLPSPDFSGYPAWECKHKYNPVYSNYMIRGRNWGVDEEKLKKIVKKGGAPTMWRYYERWEEGHQIFVAKFDMPLKSAKRLETACNKHLGIHGHKHGGVKCPHVKGDEMVFEQWDFHTAGDDRNDK